MVLCTKLILIVFLLSLHDFVVAQDLASSWAPDTRGVLLIDGSVTELSLVPDETVWLVTSKGNRYSRAKSADSWTVGGELTSEHAGFAYVNVWLDRVSFFNNRVGIATGFVQVRQNDKRVYGILRTTNSGISWKFIEHSSNERIQAAFVESDGNAWVSGPVNVLFASTDFGLSWQPQTLPFVNASRVRSIYMLNDKIGIAGSDYGELLITEDGWNTSRTISVPSDVPKYDSLIHRRDGADYVRVPASRITIAQYGGISRVSIMGDYFVVKQGGWVFYSNTKKIEWKTFPVALTNYAYDKTNDRIFGLTSSKSIVSFNNLNAVEDTLVSTSQLEVIDMQASNGELYVLYDGLQVVHFGVNGANDLEFYANNVDIVAPSYTISLDGTMWGVEGKDLYVKRKDSAWQREPRLESYVDRIKPLDAETAILWDGRSKNYRYSLKSHSKEVYMPKSVFSEFLSSPVDRFDIRVVSLMDNDNPGMDISYKSVKNAKFVVDALMNYGKPVSSLSDFTREVDRASLELALKEANDRCGSMLEISDLQISERDIQEYLNLFMKDRGLETIDVEGSFKGPNQKFWNSVPQRTDTMSAATLDGILSNREKRISRSDYHSTSVTKSMDTDPRLTVRLFNQKGDTLYIHRTYRNEPLTGMVACVVEYKGIHSTTYSGQLAEYFNGCVPDVLTHYVKSYNPVVLMCIAEYLHRQESKLSE